jgi:hypothetical protein
MWKKSEICKNLHFEGEGRCNFFVFSPFSDWVADGPGVEVLRGSTC